MPYKLSPMGIEAVDTGEGFRELTELQRAAVSYLDIFRSKGFIPSSEIAEYYKLAPQGMRGPLYWLWRKGLVLKEE